MLWQAGTTGRRRANPTATSRRQSTTAPRNATNNANNTQTDARAQADEARLRVSFGIRNHIYLHLMHLYRQNVNVLRIALSLEMTRLLESSWYVMCNYHLMCWC